ncbi:hypothetical protein HME9304_02740 [Flagellimonas maritima]|uniref:RHS repeat-associated core domain-containing protein n=1 Tax=Flagellimonas maritima TaxID=1383885 RepID=A0A2Z4LVE3_9FLAO|nr:RHS repeat-associated core domain-containing protein [Allomuricauda aurantiaca]AWX45713.1 hypothetical protein HME9304_02740 [Allomuricauda aurantiaca]
MRFQSSAFWMPMPSKSLLGAEGYRYVFQGQEKDPETRKEAFQLRLWDGRLGRWLTTDPMGEFASPYLGMGNNPILYGDPDGRDIIILNSSMAVAGLGHMAVLIGNDKDGWRYYSKNGTASHGLYGISDSPNDGAGAYGPDNLSGNDFRKTGLTASQVMRIVNNRYMEDHPDGERYDNYIRVNTTPQQDALAAEAAYAQVYSYYSVSPGLYNNGDDCGGSCLDVAQDALRATGKNFTRPNFGNILPNEWFINFGWFNNNGMYNLVPSPLTPSVEVGRGYFGAPIND